MCGLHRSFPRAALLRAALLLLAALSITSCKKSSKSPAQAPEDAASGGPPKGSVAAELPIVPVDVPPGFNYPGVRAEIETWADSWDLAKITPKAWDLWAGLTAPTQQISDGSPLPVWETWCGNEEVFGKTCGKGLRPARRFHNAVQLNHSGTTSEVRLASFNKFNPPMVAYLTKAQPGPGGASYDYTQQSSLAALNQAWPAGTSIAQRKVQEAPYAPPGGGQQGFSGIEIKPVMYLVKQKGLSPVPIWKGLNASVPSSQSDCSQGATAACHPAPTLWTTCALIDPSHPVAAPGEAVVAPAEATPEQIAAVPANLASGFSCRAYYVTSLSSIYSFKMNAQEAQEFNAAQGNGNAEAGDYAVLTAMHVNTKEIVNWTWQTFWWQPSGDPPDDFPGSTKGQTSKVTGVWRNYAMCTAYNQTKGSASKDMVVCFNPYLETASSIPDGVQSNCMSCHGTATVGSVIGTGGISTLGYPDSYTKPILFDSDPRFATFTRTDFSWAIPSDSQRPGVAK